MGLSGIHLFLVLVVVLLFFGPRRLPQLGKSFAEMISGFKKGLREEDPPKIKDVTPERNKLNP